MTTSPAPRPIAIALILLAFVVEGCTTIKAGPGGARDGSVASLPARDTLVSLPRPPIVLAENRDTLAIARLTATRTRWSELYDRTDARPLDVEQMPFLTRTRDGRRFLAATGARALARGEPAASCPVIGVAEAPQGTPLPAVATEAISSCLAALPPGQAGCGCRLAAVNGYLTVPQEEMGFATGATARLSVPALDRDQLLVADDIGAGAPVVLRGPTGPVGAVRRLQGEAVKVSLAGVANPFHGRAIPVGFRRGRIAERIYATDPEGRRLVLLIGFEPDELARGAGAWLAWPKMPV